MEKKISLKDGLFKQNIVFMSGLLTAPVIAGATTLLKALAICLVFSLVSFLTIALCRAVPRKIAYTLRVIVYSFTAAAFYIPVYLFARALFGAGVIGSAGVYLPILVTNALILSKTESRFYGEPFADMILDSAVFILGFDGACLLVGGLREILSAGTIGGLYLPLPFTIPALETTFGGFLFVGVFAGLFRGIYNRRKAALLVPEAEDGEESLAEYAEDMGEFLTEGLSARHLADGEKPDRAEKIKIYHSGKKKKRPPANLLEVEFRDNSAVVEEFAAIVAEAAEIGNEPKDEEENPSQKEGNENGGDRADDPDGEGDRR
ncbi:MAG: hypothetical protein NC084_06980 [Bacteroides sp.]|nr:hypothetical protein [Eubacterium sp.]MCM1418787.1 hypothetical protein [Roseburia sp.]MCM1462444.1 hypothetical protein [Bacteroides sp.]